MTDYPKILYKETVDGRSCIKCDYFSDGNCIRDKTLIDYSPEDNFPIFKKDIAFCSKERANRQPWRCGPKARFYRPKKNRVNAFARNATIEHSDMTGFTHKFKVIYEPGSFFMPDGIEHYILRNESTRMYKIFTKKLVESEFTQTDFSIDTG